MNGEWSKLNQEQKKEDPIYYKNTMKLILTKPLVIFDLETTGVITSKDRIVELCMIRVQIDGSRQELNLRFNPGIPIPHEITLIHGISDQDVANEPFFKDKAHELNVISLVLIAINSIFQCWLKSFIGLVLSLILLKENS